MKFTKPILACALVAMLLPLAASAQERSYSRILIRQRGWLGINTNFSAETRDGKTTETLTVIGVIKDSPAEKAGVKKGDRIVRIDGEAVTVRRFESLARALEPGDTVTLRVASDGRERDVTVVATDRPADDRMIFLPGDPNDREFRFYFDTMRIRLDSLFSDSAFFRFPDLRVYRGLTGRDSMFERGFRFYLDSLPRGFAYRSGIPPVIRRFEFPDFELTAARSVAGAEFEPLNPGLARYFDGADHGLLVIRVAPETPAARAGLEPGDVITRVDNRDLQDVAAFRAAVARADETLKLDVVREGKNRTLELDLRRRR